MWFVATMDDYVGRYSTKREAVDAVQLRIGTNRPPKRLSPGMYELKSQGYGRSTTYWIMTEEMAREQGFFDREWEA